MNSISIGDMGRSFLLQERGTALRAQLSELTNALVTGETNDPVAKLGGDTRLLRSSEYKLSQATDAQLINQENSLFFEQTALRMDRIISGTDDLINKLRFTDNAAVDTEKSGIANTAHLALHSVIGQLNGAAAGRQIFSGTATDRQPVIDATDLMDRVTSIFDDGANPADGIAGVQAWFDAPDGFIAQAYNGSSEVLADLSDGGITLSPPPRASDEPFTNLIRDVVLIALTGERPPISTDGPDSILKQTLQRLEESQSALLKMRGAIGTSQEQLETNGVSIAAEVTSLTLTINSLHGADQFTTASAIEDAQIRLQSLYAVTARTSQLSLLNFLS